MLPTLGFSCSIASWPDQYRLTMARGKPGAGPELQAGASIPEQRHRQLLEGALASCSAPPNPGPSFRSAHPSDQELLVSRLPLPY